MQWKCDAVVTLSELDAIRKQRNTDYLTRFNPWFPAAFLLLSMALITFMVFSMADNGITLTNMFSHKVVIAGKVRSIYLALALIIFFCWLGGWMAIVLAQGIKRNGKPPLAINDSTVFFDGREYTRAQISHFEQQHSGIYGVFAMIMQNGHVLRMSNASMIGTPVREYNAKVKAEIWGVIQSHLFLLAAAAIGAIVILLLFQTAG